MKIFTVFELNNLVKSTISNEDLFSNILVEGEISNFNFAISGNYYFKLKDRNSIVSIILWKSVYERMEESLRRGLKNGVKILIKGKLEVYAKNGNYSLIVYGIKIVGKGDLWLKFEELKIKLQKEGLFDQKYKKQINKYNLSIGIITSKTGSVIQDISSTIYRRFPLSKMFLYSTKVQGDTADIEIIDKLSIADKNNHDVLILARGGGSLEDLWCFNSEKLAYAIFNLKTPIVSGVGHQTDFTISDFVSDYRAETPTAAAEKIVPDLIIIIERIRKIDIYINGLLKEKFSNSKQRYIFLINKFNLLLKNRIQENVYHIDGLNNLLNNLIYERIRLFKYELESYNSRLKILNPDEILKRGYSIVLDEKKRVINSISKVEENEKISIKLYDGSISVVVKAKSKKN